MLTGSLVSIQEWMPFGLNRGTRLRWDVNLEVPESK